jgi:hypothetical protein
MGTHMMIKRIFSVTILLLVIIAARSNAADLCREKADPALNYIKTWQDLRLWYENYPECDDGYFAEGISNFVVSSFAKRWKTLPVFQREIMKNSKFKGFVMKHIDATTDENNLKMAAQNANSKCPSNRRNLCREIEKNAQSALKEMKETKE